MSDFGLFEADLDAEQAPRRKQRIAARQMAAALSEINRQFGPFVANADSVDNFEDRWNVIHKDARKVVLAHGIGSYPAVMREVHGSLKASWFAKQSERDMEDRKDDPTVEPKGDKDRDLTINDRQKKKIDKGDKTVGDEVETNTGDGSDAEGKTSSRRTAEDRDAPLLTPAGNFDAYLDGVDQGGPEKVDANDFTEGNDTGSDRREAMQLVADLYVDWAQSNRLRHASMNTLDLYAASGLHDDDYYLLAGLIRKAECECDDKDKDDSDDSSSDDSSDSSDDSDSDSDGDDSDEGSDESDASDNPFAGASDDGGEDSDDTDSGSDDESDFGGDDAAPADAEDTGGDVPPSDDGGDPFGGGDPSDAPEAGPPGDVGGQSFEVPSQAPELPPEAMDQIPQDDTQGDQAIPPEVVDQILGLPPGTIEQLVMEELQGGGGGAPPSGPPPQLARRQRRAAEDPTQAADPAAAAQPQAPAQMPAAPPAGAGSAGTMPPPGSAAVPAPPPAMPLENQPAEDALLDTAIQSVTQMIDQETQEYQQIIDPLTQALQAIEFAQQVETAENPLDVTPPEGSVDVNPSAAPGGAQALQQQAYRIARRYNLSESGYGMLIDAMSRKHYEHVGEAIRTLPPELRGGIANHIGGMFGEDNPRFNHDKWMASVGVTASRRQAGDHSTDRQPDDARSHAIPGLIRDQGFAPYMNRAPGSPTGDPRHAIDDGHLGHEEEIWGPNETLHIRGSRRPFVIRSRMEGGGRTAGENLKNTPTLDAFEFPGQGDKPQITDNMKINDLPKMKGAGLDHEAKGVLDMFDDFTKQRTDKGLNLGPAANVDAFTTEKGEAVGPKALDKLKKTITTNQRSASFFTRRVPGWKWDDHLAGYVSKEARDFTCSCGNLLPTPSYGTCRCGKLWNSYAIGDGSHLANNSADMYITREIPVRDDVIVANRRMASDDRGYGVGDTDWVEDEDRENADAPHAPGQTASRRQACWPGCHEDEAHAKKFHGDDGEKTARVNLAHDAARYLVAELVGQSVTRHDDPSFQGVVTHADPSTGTAWVQHPGGHHEMPLTDLASSGTPAPQGPSLKDRVRSRIVEHMQNRSTNGGFAGGRSAQQKQFFAGWTDEDSDGWTKYDSPDPARKNGPSKPPSTTLKGGDPKWHSRAPEGKFKSTNPFGG